MAAYTAIDDSSGYFLTTLHTGDGTTPDRERGHLDTVEPPQKRIQKSVTNSRRTMIR